ncbi:MAG: hypothetical protein JXB49_33900 [Bacteroidales bacterium]|nr:hypothetical protein [Bacteroidales bacterium]
MADTKITILGLTGSGKTTYLAGMYYRMSAGVKGFTLSSNNETDTKLEHMWEKMTDNSLGADRFPPPSDNVNKFDFKLKYAFKEIMNFEWIDYPGGAIVKSHQMRKDVIESLKSSSCVLLCVDGNAFTDEVDDPVEHLIFQGASTYTKLLNEFEDNNNFLPPVVVVITKYDLCTKGKEMADIIIKAFNALFVKDGGHNRLVTIIPVTLGKNIAQNGFTGKLDPVNINLPISFAIWCIVLEKIKSLNDLRNSLDNRINELSNSFFSIFKRGEIEDNRGLKDESDQIYTKLCQDADKLFDELSAAKKFPIYLNGEALSLADLNKRPSVVA